MSSLVSCAIQRSIVAATSTRLVESSEGIRTCGVSGESFVLFLREPAEFADDMSAVLREGLMPPKSSVLTSPQMTKRGSSLGAADSSVFNDRRIVVWYGSSAMLSMDVGIPL